MALTERGKLIKTLAADTIAHLGLAILEAAPNESNVCATILDIAATITSSTFASITDAKHIRDFTGKLDGFLAILRQTTLHNYKVTTAERTAQNGNVHYLDRE